jgi:alpha-tubulin suppressor-like RCC1 family protein/uncharacterized protein YfaP (DUF2135 family)
MVIKNTPTQIGMGSNWKSVAVGSHFTVAIKNDGTLWAWGENSYGQLGDGTTVSKSTPTQIGIGSNWKSVAAGGYHTVAVKNDGTLWAWGSNFIGQLGNGTYIDKNTPTRIGTAINWQSVTAGYLHTLAIRNDGTLWAWGKNSYGQLGDGTDFSKSTPTIIGISTTNWQSVTAGSNHTVGIKGDGTLWAWGSTSDGQLGDGTIPIINESSPIRIGSVSNWQNVSAGANHTMAIQSDGTLWAWGSNEYGKLAVPVNYNNNKCSPTRIATFSNWKSVSAGSQHTVAIKSDGTLWSWGDNFYGQLGEGPVRYFYAGPVNYIDRDSPTKIGTRMDWQSVSAGSNHTMAIENGGNLWAWGSNDNGQLGDPLGDQIVTDDSGPRIVSATPKYISGGSRSIVSSGVNHSVAIKNDGTLWSWGNNSNGQLGDGTQSTRNIPTQIGTDSNWKSVAAGENYTLAIKLDGTLWGWGDNSFGQLGKIPSFIVATPTRIGTDSNWQSVSAGKDYTVAIKNDGTLWAWGRNTDGQLGDGTTVSKSTPIQIGTGSNWQSVSAGGAHTVAIQSDGTLWAWGDNSSGQLGDGTAWTKSPVMVVHFIHSVNPVTMPNGKISPSTLQVINSGLTTNFIVIPDNNYQIDTVTGCGGSLIGNTYTTAPIDSDCMVTASFKPIIYSLTATKTGSGTGNVTVSSGTLNWSGNTGTADYSAGTSVTLTASADTGSSFYGWIGACSGTSYYTCTLTMDEAKSVTATFDPPSCNLKVSMPSFASEGNVTPSMGSLSWRDIRGDGSYLIGDASYFIGTSVTLTASTNPGFILSGWSGACSGTDPTCTVSMDGDSCQSSGGKEKQVTATFTTAYTLTATKTGDGEGAVTPNIGTLNWSGNIGTGIYGNGSSVILTANANPGSIFSGWSGACTGTATTCTVSLFQTKSVTAVFKMMYPVILTKAGSGAGVVMDQYGDLLTDSSSYVSSSSVRLSAYPNSGSKFYAWGGACSGAVSPCTVTMDAAKSVTATFDLPNVLTVYRVGGGEGNITLSNGSLSWNNNTGRASYVSGGVILTASANIGSIFSGWKGACSGTGTTCSVSMNASKSVEATFKLLYTLNVTKSGSGEGSIAPSIGSLNWIGVTGVETYVSGTNVTLTPIASIGSIGSIFSGWSGACSGTASSCTVTMDEVKSVTANFNPDLDNDGVPDLTDNCPLVANFDQSDGDADGIGNSCDSDDDNDGILDVTDNCPLIANPEQANLDGDSYGDVCDVDIDGDGVTNVADTFPRNASEWSDTDGDGIGNNADLDDDGDGIADIVELVNGTDPLDSDTSPPDQPIVTGDAFTKSNRPVWSWTTGGNGNGTFRYHEETDDFTGTYTTTTNLSVTAITDLSDGTYLLYIQERDAAGNWSTSGFFTTIVDTLVPTLNVSTLDNQTTKNATLNVSGTASDNNQLGSVTVNGIATTVTSGSFSYPFTLESGSNTITIVATDSAGNSTTTIRTVILDQNAPTLTVTTPVDNSATASILATISGSCGDAASVTVKVNNQTAQSAAITSGSYALTVNLGEGQNTLTVTAIDAVGNSSSLARTILYDVTAPTLAITLPAEDVTVHSMPYTVSGTVEDALTNVALTMTVNSQAVSPMINAANFTYQLNVPQGGTYQIVVIAKDQLENTATVMRNVIYAPYGDIDNDGATTSVDALLALQMSIGKKTVDLKADLAPLVNGVPAPDGKVTAADALVILRKAVGLW